MDASRLLQLQTTVAHHHPHRRSASRTTPQTLHFQTDSKALFGYPRDSYSTQTHSVSRSSSNASSLEASSAPSMTRPGGLTSESANSSYSWTSSSSHSPSYDGSSPSSESEAASAHTNAAIEACYNIVRCSRCQRTASLSSQNPHNQMIPFGLNVYYCHRCASLVGYKV